MFSHYKRWFRIVDKHYFLFCSVQTRTITALLALGFFTFMLIPDRTRRNEGKWMTCKTHNGFTRISITLYRKLCEHIRAQMGKDKAADLEKKYIT